MALKAIYDKQEDIPEAYRDLFTERDGKWELTGIEGAKTQADVDRVQEALRKEREDHKATKTKLEAYHEDTPESIEDLRQENERLQAQVAAGKGGEVDEAKLQEMAERIAGTRLAPVERELARVQRENEKLTGDNEQLTGEIRRGKVEDAVRAAATEAKVQVPAVEDAILMANNLFEVTDEGAVVMRDQVGFTPGIAPGDWLRDMREKRPHWWPPSQGADSSGGGAANGGGTNPWSKKYWNLTEQGRVVREQGAARADQLAKAAGSQVGATHPPQ